MQPFRYYNYLFDYADDVTDDINEIFDLNIGQQFMTLEVVNSLILDFLSIIIINPYD